MGLPRLWDPFFWGPLKKLAAGVVLWGGRVYRNTHTLTTCSDVPFVHAGIGETSGGLSILNQFGVKGLEFPVWSTSTDQGFPKYSL